MNRRVVNPVEKETQSRGHKWHVQGDAHHDKIQNRGKRAFWLEHTLALCRRPVEKPRAAQGNQVAQRETNREFARVGCDL